MFSSLSWTFVLYFRQDGVININIIQNYILCYDFYSYRYTIIALAMIKTCRNQHDNELQRLCLML